MNAMRRIALIGGVMILIQGCFVTDGTISRWQNGDQYDTGYGSSSPAYDGGCDLLTTPLFYLGNSDGQALYASMSEIVIEEGDFFFDLYVASRPIFTRFTLEEVLLKDDPVSYVEFELIGFSENDASDVWHVGPLDIDYSGSYELSIRLRNTETDAHNVIDVPFSCDW